MTSGSPEQNASKQATYMKESFENGLNDLREVCEMTAKSCFEAFDVLNKRMAESIEELSDIATKKPKKNAA
jgi:phasin family protein